MSKKSVKVYVVIKGIKDADWGIITAEVLGTFTSKKKAEELRDRSGFNVIVRESIVEM